MSKDLPYFRFTAAEWQNGDITLEGFQAQGAFINVCCYYWLADCSITLAKLKQRLNGAEPMIELLIEKDIIKHNEETDFIEIDFLNEQYGMLSDLRNKRQKAGKKGGKQKASKAKAKLKQNPSYKEKDNDKNKKGSGGLPASGKQPEGLPNKEEIATIQKQADEIFKPEDKE